FTPPRSLTSFVRDPPPPGEGGHRRCRYSIYLFGRNQRAGMNVGPTARTGRLGSGFPGCGVSAGAAFAAPAFAAGALAGGALAGAAGCAGFGAVRAGAEAGI